MINFSQFKPALFVLFVTFGIIFLTKYTPNTPLEEPAPPSIFDSYSFSAQSVFLMNDNTGKVLYEEHSDEILEFASITKIMTALVAMEEITKEIIIIDKDSYSAEGDTGLLLDEKWANDDLVKFMLVNSSNDAAEALARNHPRGREKFIERMNDRARELGIETLEFQNPTGLNETEDWGGRGSARDVATLLSIIYKKYPEIFTGTTQKEFKISSLDKEHIAENTNFAANALFGLQAGKTGYTDKAGGSFAIRFNLGLDTPIIAVILGTETREDRFEDMFEVIRATAKEKIDT